MSKWAHLCKSMPKFVGRCLNCILLAKAGQVISRFIKLMSQTNRVVPTDVRIEMMNSVVTFNTAMINAGVQLAPKNHATIHMAFNAGFMGNPAYYSTYEDEHENGLVASTGRGAHMTPACFSFTTMTKIYVMKAKL